MLGEDGCQTTASVWPLIGIGARRTIAAERLLTLRS
jgi:hypothetical protein